MKPDELDPKMRWGVMVAAMMAWTTLAGIVSGGLQQIFQPFGMEIPAFVLFGALTGAGVVMISLVLSPRLRCSECGGMLPKFRKPVSLKQALWGGCKCPHCHADLNQEGKRAQETVRESRA